MSLVTRSLRFGESPTIDKILRLMNVDQLDFHSAREPFTDSHGNVFLQEMSYLHSSQMAVHWEETQSYEDDCAHLEAYIGEATLADFSELLNLSPTYDLLYSTLEFSNVTITVYASDTHDGEYLTIKGKVLDEEGQHKKWDFLGIAFDYLPLKDLELSVTITHQSGSFKKNYRVEVTAKFLLNEDKPLNIALSIPVGNNGSWRLRLLPPGMNFNLDGLAAILMGTSAVTDLPQAIRDISKFRLNHLGIEFHPSIKPEECQVYGIDFGISTFIPEDEHTPVGEATPEEPTEYAWRLIPDDGSTLAVKHAELELSIRWASDGSFSYSGHIGGSMHVSQFDMDVYIPLPAHGIMTLGAKTTEPLPNLGTFTDLLGGTKLTSMLPSGMKDSFALDIQHMGVKINLDDGNSLDEFNLKLNAHKEGDEVAWPVWEGHLDMDEFALDIQMARPEGSWTIEGSIYGRGKVEGVPLGVSINKTREGLWKIYLTDPIIFPGLNKVNSLTEVNVQDEENEAFPGDLSSHNESNVVLKGFGVHLQNEVPRIPYVFVHIATEGSMQVFEGLWLRNMVCQLYVKYPLVPETRDVSGKLAGTIRIGAHDLYLKSERNANKAGWTYQGRTRKGDAIELSYLFNKLLERTQIPHPKNFPKISIQDVALSYTPSEKKLLFSAKENLHFSKKLNATFSVDLDYNGSDPDHQKMLFAGSAVMRVASVVFDLQTKYSSENNYGWEFHAKARDTVSLSELLRDALEDTRLALPDVLPVEFSMSNVTFDSKPKVKYYEFEGDGHLELSIGKVDLEVDAHVHVLRPELTSESAEKEPLQVTVRAEGHLDVAGQNIQLNAETTGNQKGWDLRSKGVGLSLSMDNLMTDLSAKFDIDTVVPNPVADLTITELDLALNTKSGDFRFSAGGAMTFGNQPNVFINAYVNVSHNQDGSVEKSFAGNLVLGTELPKKFDLVFDMSSSGSLMLATYESTDGDVVSIKDLAGDILGIHIPDSITFTLKDAVLAYESHEDKKKSLFISHMGNGVNLANLPLVGQLVPGDKQLTLNYQVIAASAEFSADEVKAINELLPENISALPLVPLSDGLDVSVLMHLAGKEISFNSPIQVNEEEKPEQDGVVQPVIKKDEPVSAGTDDSIKWLSIQKSVGPVHFNRIGVKYEDSNLHFLLDASMNVGGLEIDLDELSVTSSLTKFEPSFGLKGLGIDFSNKVFEIGASLLRESFDNRDEYNGAAIMGIKKVSIGAIGSYTYINDRPSLFLYGALNIPIGGPPYFFVMGLSAGFGYNRALKMPAMDDVLHFPLVAEAMNGISLPPDSGRDILIRELKTLHQYIPPSIGNMFLAVGLKFTTFKLIDTTVLVTASFGKRFELNLLGVSTLRVPPVYGTPLAEIQMAIKGSLVPDEGFAGISGQLTDNSFILSRDCRLTGGFAFYVWFSGPHLGDFVASIGGYHPDFNVPDHYPKVPGVGLSWKLDHRTSIKGDAYFAICPHALMAGGHLEVNFHEGALSAWFKLAADFMVAWQPYHYSAKAYAHFNGSYTYHFWGTHHISVDVGAEVEMSGPNFGGTASLDLYVTSIDIKFGDGNDRVPEPLDWGDFERSFLPEDDRCHINVMDGLVDRGHEDGFLGVINPKHLVIQTETVIPSKQAYLGSMEQRNGDWNTGFGIAPMDLGSGKVDCRIKVIISKIGANSSRTDYSQHFVVESIKKRVPAAMWGKKYIPEVNDPQFVENTLGGLEVRPLGTPERGNTATISLDAALYDTTVISNAMAWEGRSSFQAIDLPGNGVVEIVQGDANDPSESRQQILKSLGVEETIDLGWNTDGYGWVATPAVM